MIQMKENVVNSNYFNFFSYLNIFISNIIDEIYLKVELDKHSLNRRSMSKKKEENTYFILLKIFSFFLF